MLSLAVTTHLKRRTLRQRLRLCLNEKIIKDSFCSHYGEINIYRIYHFSKKPFFTPERLEKALKERLYTPDSPVPEEYLKKAVLLRLTEKLKTERGKTVFLSDGLCRSPLLGQLCRYSSRVYIMSDALPDNAEEIYKSYGTLPIVTSIPVAADYCPDIREPFDLSLPKEYEEICPKEFSPLLFAALLYKENGVMIL